MQGRGSGTGPFGLYVDGTRKLSLCLCGSMEEYVMSQEISPALFSRDQFQRGFVIVVCLLGTNDAAGAMCASF